MTEDRERRIEELYRWACELSPDEQKALLDQHCTTDSELRREVETLLTRSLDRAPRETETVDARHPQTLRRVGHYHIKRAIGSGGMGTVYEATQEKPRRTVALKLMRQGIASRSALRRFEYESQLLARLHHPSIAQVYDAGTHRDGEVTVPYFAMEYIVGAKALTDYAKEKKLGTRERMTLFANVCGAVHHGHQKGIIHRDLKPSNILVDSSGLVKIIDFGVARSTDSDMAVTTLQTDVGQLLGTLQYMSPEQCAADPHDIDTRSDVYALGVVFYELLCDRLPYDIKGAAIHEATRVIREQEPTRLSTLNKALRGDVETIALKALAKDRERRYQSAAELGEDIRRYLNGEAIAARPPSMSYQLRLFARRYKALVGAAAAVLVILVGAIVVSTSFALQATAARNETQRQYLEAQRARTAAEMAKAAEAGQRLLAETERDRALRAEQDANDARLVAERERDRATVEHQRANRESETSKQVAEFLVDLFEVSDPSEARGESITAREVLDRGSRRITDELVDQPGVQATLMHTIGRVYFNLALYDDTRALFQQALAIRRRELGNLHEDVASLLYGLGEVGEVTSDYVVAEAAFVECLEIRRKLWGDDHPLTGNTLGRLAAIRHLKGEFTAAERIGVQIGMRVMGWSGSKESFSRFVYDQIDKVRKLWTSGEQEGAFRLLHELSAPFEERFPQVLFLPGATAFANWCVHRGEYDVAEPVLRMALAKYRDLYGDEHLAVVGTCQQLANVLRLKGDYDAAEPLREEVAATYRKLLGEEHPHTLRAVNNLAKLCNKQGRYDEAERLYLHTLEIGRRVLGEEHPATLNSMNNLGLFYASQGRFDEAEPLHASAVAGARSSLREGHRSIGVFLGKHGGLLTRLERYDEAEKALLESHKILETALGATREQRITTIRSLIDLYDAWSKPSRATEWRAKLPALEFALPPGSG